MLYSSLIIAMMPKDAEYASLVLTATSTMSQVRPHEEIWFQDGNVLLIAENMSFRVHKSMLARHSEFFHDMFKLPQPPQTEGGTIDEAQCPTVDTSESAEDLTHFLNIIYNSIQYFRKDTQLSYAAIRAILRLSQKFSSEPLRAFAIGRLQAAFPRRFIDWEALAQRRVPQPIMYEARDLLSIANFAHELELVDVLPVVLYDCCQLSLDWILDGMPADNTEEGAVRNDEEGRTEGRQSVRRRVRLTPENQKAVIVGRERLMLATVKMLSGLAYARHGRCDQFTCTNALRDISMGGIVKGDAIFDPLTALNSDLATDPPQLQHPPLGGGGGLFGNIGPPVGPQQGFDVLCRACRESCRNHLRITRERLLRNIEDMIPVDYLQTRSVDGAEEM